MTTSKENESTETKISYDGRVNNAKQKPDGNKKSKIPIQDRIRKALESSGGVLEYHALLYQVFPAKDYPGALRNSSNGGPPGCAMALGQALRKMFENHEIHDSWHEYGRKIFLRNRKSA